MLVIKRIEIKNFRSIDHIILDEGEVKSMNVIVGSNDIGKSNVLRALNLFFNGETDLGKRFDFDEDFNKNKPRSSGKGQYVMVVLDIEVLYEKEKTVRWKKKWLSNGLLEKNHDWALRTNDGQPSNFISGSRAPRWLTERIVFRYVPAIKSPKYFEHLYSSLHDVLSSTYSEEFKQGTEQLISKIQDITKSMTDEIREQLGMENKLSVPRDLKTFFTSLDFSSKLNDQAYHLTSRGDGIKARHIPVVLKFLADNAKAITKGSLTVTTIWGYEEPENNLEMKHAFELANLFLKYSTDVQIFTSTHSPAFYSLKQSNKCSTWYLDRDSDGYTHSRLLSDEIDLDHEMGVLDYITPFVSAVNEELTIEKENRKKLEQKLTEISNDVKVIVFTEDSAGELNMIKALLESNGYNLAETEVISYAGKGNLKSIIHSAKWLRQNQYTNASRMIFHVDQDVDGNRFKEWHKENLPKGGQLFVTPGYDMDSLFVSKEHYLELYPELESHNLDEIISISISESESKSLEKIEEGCWQSLSAADRAGNEGAPKKIRQKALTIYNSKPAGYFYGKAVLGRVKGKINSLMESGFNPYQPSRHLVLKELQETAKQVWNE